MFDETGIEMDGFVKAAIHVIGDIYALTRYSQTSLHSRPFCAATRCDLHDAVFARMIGLCCSLGELAARSEMHI